MAHRSKSLPTNSTRIGRALRAGRLLLAVGLALVGTAGPTAAETKVVQQLPFSFMVPDSLSGKNVTFLFQLWDAAALTQGSLLWQESKTILVPASLSITHKLGSVVSFADPDPVTHTMDPVDFGRQLWVEVRRGAVLVGKGRVRLAPVVPYALWSAASETVGSTAGGNTAVGSGALQKSDGSGDNTAVGAGALANTEGGGFGAFNNTAVGARALGALAPFVPGGGDDGQENTAVGVDAMAALTSGGNNVALGVGALRSITHGAGNCAIGYKALENNVSSSNVAVGDRAGRGAAGDAGYNNTFLGSMAGPTESGLSNATAIGANATVGTSNSLALGGTGADAVSVGIGTASPKKRLHVVDGDIYVDSATINAGIILRATDNSSVCKKITINAAGTVAVATIACP